MKRNHPETKTERNLGNYKELADSLEEYFQSYSFWNDKIDAKAVLDLIQAHRNIEKDILDEE